MSGDFAFEDSTLLTLALDEIWRLRRALAYEADVVAAHLDYRTFPKSRRLIADGQIERMRQAVLAGCRRAYAGTSSLSLRGSAARIGFETFSRYDFEKEMHRRGEVPS